MQLKIKRIYEVNNFTQATTKCLQYVFYLAA
jgi:hypothetical protein